MTRAEEQTQEAYERSLRRLKFWMRIALLLIAVGLAAQIAALALRQPPPTMHTRRITTGGETVGVEIPDGGCATLRGVTLCIPDRFPHRAYVEGGHNAGRIHFAEPWPGGSPTCVAQSSATELDYLCFNPNPQRKVSP